MTNEICLMCSDPVEGVLLCGLCNRQSEGDRLGWLLSRRQFVEDYLLVAMNDYEAHEQLMEWARSLTLDEFAQQLEDDFDGFVESLSDSTGGQFPSLLVGQLLGCWGSDTFRMLAKEITNRIDN